VIHAVQFSKILLHSVELQIVVWQWPKTPNAFSNTQLSVGIAQTTRLLYKLKKSINIQLKIKC